MPNERQFDDDDVPDVPEYVITDDDELIYFSLDTVKRKSDGFQGLNEISIHSLVHFIRQII